MSMTRRRVNHSHFQTRYERVMDTARPLTIKKQSGRLGKKKAKDVPITVHATRKYHIFLRFALTATVNLTRKLRFSQSA